MKQKLIFTNLVGEAIDTLVGELGNPQVAVVADTNTAQFVLPILRNDSKAVAGARLISIKSGDANKNLDELQTVWRELSAMEAYKPRWRCCQRPRRFCRRYLQARHAVH